MSRIYLTSLASDVTGYKLALIDTRNPDPPSSVATATTNTSGAGDNIQMTATAGGTALAWITKPMSVAVTLATKVYCNIWAKESNASANAGLGIQLINYTAGAEDQTALDHNDTVELTTSMALTPFITVATTSQALAVGDRLVIKMQAVAVGTMGGSQTVVMDYDGATGGSDGDTFILLQENLRANERQLRNGSFPVSPGFGQGFYQNIIDGLNTCIGAKQISSYAAIQSVIDDLGYERDNL